MRTPLGVAIVGLNRRVERQIVPGFAAAPRGQVVALCSRDSTKADRVAGTVDGCVGYDSLDEMLTDRRVDVVFIATPPAVHAPIAIRALAAGKMVICEKPLADTLGSANAMVAAIRSTPTAVNFTYRDVTAFRVLKRELENAPIGRLLHADLAYLQDRALVDPAIVTDPHLEIGSHLIDVLLWVGPDVGAADLVSASAAPSIGSSAQSRAAILELSSGALATYQVCRVAAGHANAIRVHLYGTEGSLRLDFDTEGFTLTRFPATNRATGVPIETPEDCVVGYADFPAYHFDRLLGALRGEVEFPDFQHGLRVQRVLDAIDRSERTGQRVVIG
ncbi:MAG: Gfo/Idh/MocA family oxidoreductase [Chloroflexota bacterium]|nr:MAG: Gfo/Idh/MocA family oxidoreductase [Chloroflexota bacterium]